MSEASAPAGTLLLCLDLQPVFLQAIADGKRVLRRCEFAVAAAKGLGLPLAFTEQVPLKLGHTAPSLLSLAPDSVALAKESFSAFADEGIREVLLQRGVEHVLLCGLETPVCVYQTAIDARSAGIEVTLLSDCVGARRENDAAVALAALARSGVHVLSAETVFYALLRDAKHPFFKTYTELVKSHG